MFGSGIHGRMAILYNAVVAGRYIHVRGQEGRISLVTACDVARAVRMLWRSGGVYNVTDGRPATWLELAEAMSANHGAMKRMITLPRKWAELAVKTGIVKGLLSREVIDERGRTLTYSADKLCQAIDWQPFSTIEVIKRTATGYPYQDR